MLSATVNHTWTGSVAGGGLADDAGRSTRASSSAGVVFFGCGFACACTCFGACFAGAGTDTVFGGGTTTGACGAAGSGTAAVATAGRGSPCATSSDVDGVKRPPV